MRVTKASLEAIAKIIADYRQGEIPAPAQEHVSRWIAQFPEATREPILIELAHAFNKTFFSKPGVERFLSSLVANQKITKGPPTAFWQNTKCLEIQAGGNSQHDMLQMLDASLQRQIGLRISDCGAVNPSRFVYLDDGLFTGNRILRDLSEWIVRGSPVNAEVHVIVIALHNGGAYYANQRLQTSAAAAGKQVQITWWRCVAIEDRKNYTNSSDVLRPASVPDDPRTQAYMNSLRHQQVLRAPGNVGPLGIFSNEDGRNLLEQEFLKAGVLIRERCPNLNSYQRPLGNSVLETFGFGSLIATFRNCPNNAPLALWAGDPWYPLLPRRIN